MAGSVAGMGLAALGGGSGTAAAALPARPLGRTGWNATIFAFGGGSRYATVLEDEEEAGRIVDRAIDLGVNYFDNAYAYGNNQMSQKRYGRYLCPKYRSRIFLTNKSLQREAGEYMREFDESLENMKTDVIDLMYFHGVDEMDDLDTITGKGGALEAARKLQDQKAVRFLGMSGHRNPDAIIEAIDRIGLDVVMIPVNAARADNMIERVIPHAKCRGTAVMAMKTTAQDKLIGKGGAKPTDLVRYAMSCPVTACAVGIPSMDILESCCEVARTFSPMSGSEMRAMETKVDTASIDGSLYYRKPSYVDSHMA